MEIKFNADPLAVEQTKQLLQQNCKCLHFQ